MSRTCWLCERAFIDSSMSDEHIMPNAIGGRTTVRGFICRDCNNGAGERWDAALTSQLNFLALLFDISRQRGAVPSMRFTTTGKTVEVLPGNRGLIGQPVHEVPQDGKTINIRMQDRSVAQSGKGFGASRESIHR